MLKALKLKKANAEIISVRQVTDKNPELKAKNYGVFAIIRQLKSSRVHKMYSEIREVSRCSAIEKFIDTICGQYSLDRNQINICKIEEITDTANLKKNCTSFFSTKTCSFPKAF